MKRGRKEERKKRSSEKPIIISIIVIVEIIIFMLGFLAGTMFKKSNPPEKITQKDVNIEEAVKPSEEANPLVEDIISGMSVSDMIYQLIFTTPESITDVEIATRAGDSTKNALENYPVGGLIYFEKNYESDEQISKMIENSKSYSNIPLFIGADEFFRENSNELGFDSIVSDDASFNELKNDMIFMPENLEEAHSSLLNDVEGGSISKEEIEKRVRKILSFKIEKGIIK